MSVVDIGLLLMLVLFLLLGSGIWVALSLLGVGLFAIFSFTSAPVGMIMGTSAWGSVSSWALAPLPLFIWMGEILFRSRLSEDMYTGLSPWLNRIPGGLLHTNVLGCGVFAAVSGSSAATAATIGRMSIPELRRRGYPDGIVIGSLAGAGTLGLLIPPSIILIVYGVSAQLSIGRLFIAGVLPGLLLVLLFMGYIMLWALRYREQIPAPEASMPILQRLRSSGRLIPVI